MAMSDDPRGYRRGQPGNQRPEADVRGRNDGRGERERQPAPSGNGRTPSFSAYRPEAFANNDKRAARPDWDDGRSAPPQRPQSPTAEAYPRPAPERPAAQSGGVDPRDPYRGQPDPYAPPQQNYEPDWRSPSYAENKQYGSFYDDTPPAADPQAVHDRFFASAPEPERPANRYRGGGNTSFDDHSYEPLAHDREEPAFAPQQPAPRAFQPEPRERDYAWDSFEQAPAPAAARPYAAPQQAAPQLPATTHGHPQHDDDMDADFFGDEDEFEGDEYHEEKKSGRTKLVAAVLVGAIVTGGGLAWLYKSSTHRMDGSEPPVLTADASPVKESPRGDPGGRKFPGSKQIQGRLGDEGDNGEAPVQLASGSNVTTDSSEPLVTTGGGTLEERINTALVDAKRAEAPQQSESVDAPTTVKTVQVRPDGTMASAGGDSQASGRNRGFKPAQVVGVSPEVSDAPVVTTQPAARPARGPAQPQQQVAMAPAPQQEIPEAQSGTGAYFVQIGARNDQAQALAAFNGMQQKYASVLGNYSPSVKKADLGEKGIWYRLRVGPFNGKAESDKLCEDLKTAGWKQCFTVKD